MDETAATHIVTSDSFIRHVGHDLRSSLNAVVAWGELVRGGQLPPAELARAGDTIVRQARQVSRRLADALDLWRLDVGALIVSTAPAQVGSVIRSSAETARATFDARRVACNLDLEDDGTAELDPSRLGQALTLLLVDSAANTPPGEAVDVLLQRTDGHLVISVTGGGRAPGEHAFNRDAVDTLAGGPRPFDFGLSLARTLVSMNGGTLSAEPDDRGRLAFVVRLEAVDGHAPAPQPASA